MFFAWNIFVQVLQTTEQLELLVVFASNCQCRPRTTREWSLEVTVTKNLIELALLPVSTFIYWFDLYAALSSKKIPPKRQKNTETE